MEKEASGDGRDGERCGRRPSHASNLRLCSEAPGICRANKPPREGASRDAVARRTRLWWSTAGAEGWRGRQAGPARSPGLVAHEPGSPRSLNTAGLWSRHAQDGEGAESEAPAVPIAFDGGRGGNIQWNLLPRK